MRTSRRKPIRAGAQQGYALLMMVIFVALLVITLSAATRNLLTQERREKEQELIWRGQQYVRGIHLYYQKTHRFPMELEDLYKPKTGIRFMRKAYKDPLNTADGSWRLIYIGPNGQIIGSLQPAFLFPTHAQTPFTDSLSTPRPAANDPLSSASTLGSFALQNLSSSSPTSAANRGNNPAVNARDAGSNASLSAPDPGTPQSIAQPLDSGLPATGNAIIGVGSKINKASIIWYEKAKDYRHFEFIWKAKTADPLTVTPNP